MKKLRYLAYGSNLHPIRLQKRVTSACFQGTVILSGWALQFHKRGQDGSAKCDIIKTYTGESTVYGALYAIAAAEKEYLDKAEGLGKGYERMAFHHLQYGRFFCYVATPSHIDNTLKPFAWYKEYVSQGAKYHDFPLDYIEKIEAVSSIADDNRNRCKENQKILAQMMK